MRCMPARTCVCVGVSGYCCFMALPFSGRWRGGFQRYEVHTGKRANGSTRAAPHASGCPRSPSRPHSGPGVVGEQPILNPGQAFEYKSHCPLRTRCGTMEGRYEFVRLQPNGEWGAGFDAKVGRFGLRGET